MMEFDRERAGPLPERTNAQKHKRTKTQTHKNTKTQKHKSTETQKHRNTVYSGTPIFLVYCPFYCQHMNVLETCNGQPWHWLYCWPFQSLKIFLSIVIWFWSFWFLQSFFSPLILSYLGFGVFYFGGETQTHRNTNAQTHRHTNAHSHKRTLAHSHRHTYKHT